jgi:hypothetical protein
MTILVNQRDDGRCESTCILTSEAVPACGVSPPAARTVRLRLEKLATGCWSVQAVAGTRGGLFRDHASATKFIRREFAAWQHTVVETLPA